MKLSIAFTLCAFLAATSSALAQEVDLTGPWTFVWGNDSKNTNTAALKHERGTITGTYLNDAKESCRVVGRLTSSGTGVYLTITCPRWDIKCDGSIQSPHLITGQYVAYGTASGTFQMTRK
jgi:hypothetical protein